MRISDILRKDVIKIELKGHTKEEVINELCNVIVDYWGIKDKNEFLDKILERESIESTGIGRGIALPHARTDAVRGVVIAFGRSLKGIDYNSWDQKPVYMVFMIGSSHDSNSDYIKILSSLSCILRIDEFRERIMEAKTPDEIIDTIKEFEDK